jgi:aspartate/methionine/tyrosine aminotransferase
VHHHHLSSTHAFEAPTPAPSTSSHPQHTRPALPPLQIARRRRAHQEQHPGAKIISLGIGDTTEPLPKVIADAMAKAANGLATREGYSG